MLYSKLREGEASFTGARMGDSYRAEKTRRHTKSGFRTDPKGLASGAPRTLDEERRALRVNYFKAKRRTSAYWTQTASVRLIRDA